MFSQCLRPFLPSCYVPHLSWRVDSRLDLVLHGYQAKTTYNRFASPFFFFFAVYAVISTPQSAVSFGYKYLPWIGSGWCKWMVCKSTRCKNICSASMLMGEGKGGIGSPANFPGKSVPVKMWLSTSSCPHMYYPVPGKRVWYTEQLGQECQLYG